MRRGYAPLALGLSLLIVSLAWPAGDTLFRASFEKGFDADEAGGKAAPLANAKTALVPDRFGQSLVLSPGGGTLSYAAAGNVDLQQGSVILWVQPRDLASARNPVFLLSASQGDASLALLWEGKQRTLRFVTGRQGRTAEVVKPAYDWTEPTWHYLVATWSPAGPALYVDGQAAAASRPAAGKTRGDQLTLGGDFGGTASLSFRSLSILKTPLTADQVQEKYRVAMSGQVQHERPLLTVGQCAKPPTVDGKVEDAEWAAGGGTAGFVEIASGQLTAAQTRVLVTYDETNVYVAFICPTRQKPFANKTARDAGSPWDEDCVEAWLQPEVGFTGKYFHVIVNAAGSLYDLEDQSAAWNGTSAWAASQDDSGWSAEFAVPHAALGTMAPTPGTKWQANFCRSFGGSGATNRHTAWAFTNGSGYGVWQWFGAVQFAPSGPVARVTGWTAAGTDASAQVQLANPGPQPVPVSADLIMYRAGMGEDTREVAVGPWTLAPGEVRTETIATKASFAADQVKLQVRSGEKPLLVQTVRAGAKEAVGATAPAVSAGPSGSRPLQAPKLTQEMLAAVVAGRKLWEHNRIGITNAVPPPWTPMTLTGKTVGCWGRRYDYAASLFPRQVTAQSAELLAGPVALVAKIGGKEIVLQKADQQSATAAPNEVNFDARTAAGNLTARVQSHLEFDGCIKLTLTLASKGQPVRFDNLELRLPVKPERALYYHWFEATRDPRLTNAGALPEAGLKTHFKPLLWLGDDDRGLCWFAESPRGWQINDAESVLTVRRDQGRTVACIRMVDRPWQLDGQWQTVFGLMATPSRPTPPGCRNWLIPLNQTNPWGTWAPGFNNLSGTDDPGTLMPKDPAAMKRWVEDVQKHGESAPYYPGQELCRAIPYSQVVFWSGKYRDGMPAPEIKVFGPEWSNITRPPGPRQEPDEQIPLKEYYWVCPNSSFSQYYIYKLNQLLDQVPLDGIYIDGSWWFCSNKQHGCGYADDQGVWQKQYNIWAFRELFKRMYCLFYARRQSPVLHFHTSCWLALPCLSFCHMMLDGEQYHDAAQKVEDHFMDIVPLDKWRAEHSTHFGPAPFILPDIPGQWAQAQAPTRELLMLTNLHDVGIFPGSFNTRLMMRNYQARRLFGVADCQFRGYWKTDWAACATPDGHVSVYRKPDGARCLLVVGNSAKQDNTLTVKPNLAALKLRGPVTAGVDLETGEKLALTGGVLTVPVKARDFRLIALPAYAPPPITAGDLRATALTTLKNPGFEEDMSGWMTSTLEGNGGSITLDAQVKYAGKASCHLYKAEGPGGVHLETRDVLAVTPGQKYRVNCQLKIVNSTGAQAYWMISATDNEGTSVLSNNLFAGFVKTNQDFTPLPYEFVVPPGAVAIRLHFLVAFPGSMDAWVDDFRFEEVR
ncbi:DUF6067 family protein [bacterium]|nr:DUF6067 family protein [bacterium]